MGSRGAGVMRKFHFVSPFLHLAIPHPLVPSCDRKLMLLVNVTRETNQQLYKVHLQITIRQTQHQLTAQLV